MTTEERLDCLEKHIEALTTAFQLSLVAARPASEWLDAQLEKIYKP